MRSALVRAQISLSFMSRPASFPTARDPLPDLEQKQTALSYLNEAWAEARHEGVDLIFVRRPEDREAVGSPNGSRGFVMPNDQLALAASDGRVWSCAWTPRGWTIVIDLAPTAPVATYYTHPSQLLVVPKQAVRAGQPIGIIGADPLDPARLAHLHLEIWRGGAADRFDPEQRMKAWEYLPDPGDLPEVLLARNARIAGRAGDLVRVRQHTRSYPRR